MTARPGRWALMRKEWQPVRHAVLERDQWQCQHCGARGQLEVHHTKPVRDFPEEAFNPALCLTLCRTCHTQETHRECGRTPRPERVAWRKAVAELATSTDRAQGVTNA